MAPRARSPVRAIAIGLSLAWLALGGPGTLAGGGPPTLGHPLAAAVSERAATGPSASAPVTPTSRAGPGAPGAAGSPRSGGAGLTFTSVPSAVDLGSEFLVNFSYDGSGCALGSDGFCLYVIVSSGPLIPFHADDACEQGPANVSLIEEFETTSQGTPFPTDLEAEVWTADEEEGCTTTDLITSGNVSLVVDPALVATLVPTSVPDVDLGQSLVLVANVSGGSGSYAYSWEGLTSSQAYPPFSPGRPPGCAGNSTDRMTCTPDAPGRWGVGFGATDSNGGSVSLPTEYVSVDPDLTINGTWMVEPAQLGDPLYLHVAVSGGTGWENETWTGLPPGCLPPAPPGSPTLTCTPNATGIFHPVFRVSDARGEVLTHTFRVNVPGLSSGGYVEGVVVGGSAAAAGAVAVGSVLWWRRRRSRARDGA